MECDMCELVKDDVCFIACPFESDVNDKIVYCYLCSNCYEEKKLEI